MIKCLLCDYEAKCIHQHVRYVHNISSTEYRDMFGDNIVMRHNCKPFIKKKSKNYVTDGYDIINDKIKSIDNLYPLDKVINMLLDNDRYKSYIGRTKYRTLIKDDIVLYKSILSYTSILDFNMNKVSLSHRLRFICELNMNIDMVYCECGLKCNMNPYCRSCKPTYPSKKWFIYKYGDSYKPHMILDKEERKIKHKNQLSYQWFIDKYGDDGHYQYTEHYTNLFENQKCRYSKQSQVIFDLIYDSIDPTLQSKTKYATLNGEHIVHLNDSQIKIANQKMYMLDFVCGNVNIEFDSNGYYIKDELYIENRDNILRDNGYHILRVTDDEFACDMDMIIDKCVRFIYEN